MAAGARTLYSNTRPRHVRLVATALAAATGGRPWSTAGHRTFHSSPPSKVSAPAAEPNGAKEEIVEGAKIGENDKINQQQPGSTTPESRGDTESSQIGNGHQETAKFQASSFVRSRAFRARAYEELPPVELQPWFLDGRVDLFDPVRCRPPVDALGARSATLMEWLEDSIVKTEPDPPSESDREKTQVFLMAVFEKFALGEVEVIETKEDLGNGDIYLVQSRLNALQDITLLLVLALGRHSVDEATSLAKKFELPWRRPRHGVALRLASSLHHLKNGLAWNIGKYYVHMRTVQESALQTWPDVPSRTPTRCGVRREILALQELRHAVQAQLKAEAPKNKTGTDLNRPVSILAVMNYKGAKIATRAVQDVALQLRADAVHLDAWSLAEIVGRHLGQTPVCARSPLSVLGYTVAGINGRLIPRPEPADSDGQEDLFRMVSARVKRHFQPKNRPLSLGGTDDRWDDLKVNQALEELVCAADVKRARERRVRPPARNLIVHVPEYVELSMTREGAHLLGKLRSIVDRMWQRGQRIVMVGSTSGDIENSDTWLEQLADMTREGTHVIPYRLLNHRYGGKMRKEIESNEKREYLFENLNNIEAMLRALVGSVPKIEFEPFLVKHVASFHQLMSEGIFDVAWVYGIASRMAGRWRTGPDSFNTADLFEAFRWLEMRNIDLADESFPNERPPYFWPSASGSSGLPRAAEKKAAGGSSSPLSGSSHQSLDEYEKKLLSGLIDVEDIKTTFDDIVAPPDIKDSLMALTTLSLVRPEAFSYGVLATERIPGCLLYGPPGTGKTLMGKAIAKSSRSNMLEVSAASINDMWVGQSEKNVRALFSLAKKMSPMVIFLDEADALLGARTMRAGRSAHRETINQFLREWDGLTDTKAFIMVATNRPFDLDEAVLRRLPRKILVDLPLLLERTAILRIMLRDEVLDASVSLDQLAAETELYSGSDIKNLCVAAAMEAVKDELRAEKSHRGLDKFVFPDKRVITRAHFDKALHDISASISEDMESLKAIRKFDQRYGDSRHRRRRQPMGFEVIPGGPTADEARVRRSEVLA